MFSAVSFFQLSVGNRIPRAAQPGAGPCERLFSRSEAVCDQFRGQPLALLLEAYQCAPGPSDEVTGHPYVVSSPATPAPNGSGCLENSGIHCVFIARDAPHLT